MTLPTGTLAEQGGILLESKPAPAHVTTSFFYVSYTAPHHGGPTDPDDPPPIISDTGREQRFQTSYVPADARDSLDDVISAPP